MAQSRGGNRVVTEALPWVGLGGALAAWLLRESTVEEEQKPAASSLVPGIVGSVALGAAAYASHLTWGASLAYAGVAVHGLLLGLGASIIVAVLGRIPGQSAQAKAAPIAFGAAAVALLALAKPPTLLHLQLGYCMGAVAGGWMLASPWAIRAAVASCVLVPLEVLGRIGFGGNPSHSGAIVGVSASYAALIVWALPGKKLGERLPDWIRGLAFVAFFAGGFVLLGMKYLLVEQFAVVGLGGVALALASLWVVPRSESESSLGYWLSTILWVAGATLAFGILRGYGVALGLAVGACVLLVFRHPRALSTLAPVAGIVVYRVFRENHLAASRALDIGQHYSLIGILAGAMLIVLALEWYKEKGRSGFASGAGAFLWVGLLAGAVIVSASTLAAKGYVGMLAGMGLGGALAGVNARGTGLAIAWPLGLGLGMTASYGWISPILELSRDEKARALYVLGPVVVALAILLAIVSRRAGDSVGEQVAQ